MRYTLLGAHNGSSSDLKRSISKSEDLDKVT